MIEQLARTCDPVKVTIAINVRLGHECLAVDPLCLLWPSGQDPVLNISYSALTLPLCARFGGPVDILVVEVYYPAY